MSILHLLGTAGEGGAETYFLDLVRALARAGGDQVVALRANPHRQAVLKALEVPALVSGFGGPLDILTRPRVAHFARQTEVRLALAWMNRAARHTPKGPWARIGRLGGYYNLKYYKGFDALVANTEDIADWIVRQGWPAGRVHFIPNFAAAPEGEDRVDRASLNTPPGVPLLLSMGRLHEAKAQDVAIEALTRIPEAVLWIAGVGPQEARLKAMAQALGVGERVRFLGWRTDASALYRTADVCVFPSRYEPLGNVVIQAWAHGLPVVAAASQGPMSLIRNGQDGRLVPVDDADALAEAIVAVLAAPDQARQMAERGRARVQAEFSPEAVVVRWQDLFAQYGAG